jgi:hypothetical protein
LSIGKVRDVSNDCSAVIFRVKQLTDPEEEDTIILENVDRYLSAKWRNIAIDFNLQILGK